MSLKYNWIDRQNGVDDVDAEDINKVAHAVIEVEERLGETGGGAGSTFFPAVSENGIISWTNDGGLPNPTPINIKGPQGPTGKTAYQYAKDGGYTGTEAEFASLFAELPETLEDLAAHKADIPSIGEFTERNIMIFDSSGNIKDSGVAIDKVYQIGTTWAYIKNICTLGIADRVFEAGMQLTDRSDKYGDVIFDVVNVTPTEVIVQSHDVIGDDISTGYYSSLEYEWTEPIQIAEIIPSGTVICAILAVAYNQGHGLYDEEWERLYFILTRDVPIGEYALGDFYEYGDQLEDYSGYAAEYYEIIHYDDIDQPPQILLKDYADSITDGMSEDFRKNAGRGFVPLVRNVGVFNDDYSTVWQLYENVIDPYNDPNGLLIKSRRWAVNDTECDISAQGGIQGLEWDGNSYYYYSNGSTVDGYVQSDGLSTCSVAPAFRITGGNGI